MLILSIHVKIEMLPLFRLQISQLHFLKYPENINMHIVNRSKIHFDSITHLELGIPSFTDKITITKRLLSRKMFLQSFSGFGSTFKQ